MVIQLVSIYSVETNYEIKLVFLKRTISSKNNKRVFLIHLKRFNKHTHDKLISNILHIIPNNAHLRLWYFS